MYKLFLLKLNFSLIKQLFNLTKYEEVSKEIMKKKTIKTMNRILNIIYNKPVSIKFTKIILTTFISSQFTNILTDCVDINEDPISLSIHNRAKNIVNILKHIYTSKSNRFMVEINMHIFKKEGDKLINEYSTWEIADKQKIIHELLLIYIENYEFGEKHPELKQTIENEQIGLIRKAHSLISNIDETYFKTYLNNYINNKKEFNNMITENIHKAYWDSIKSDIEERKFIVLIPLLKDVKFLLKECVPRRKDIHVYIDEHIDCEFIEHMINSDAIDNEYIKKMCHFIYGYLVDFQPRCEDKPMGIWFSKTIKLLDEYKYGDFFINFFKKITDKLNNIIFIKKTITN